MLAQSGSIATGGLLNAFNAAGLRPQRQKVGSSRDEASTRHAKPSKVLYKQSRSLIALDRAFNGVKPKGFFNKLSRKAAKSGRSNMLLAFIESLHEHRLAEVDSDIFHDFIWTAIFEKTLGSDARRDVLATRFFATDGGWHEANEQARYLKLASRIETTGWDIFLTQTPSPFNVSPGTRTLVRYHDAIPLFYPHTLGMKAGGLDARQHYFRLRLSVKNRAFFACTSEPVRNDLLRLYPETEKDSAVIPDVVSSAFRPEAQTNEIVAEILVRRRCQETFGNARPPQAMIEGPEERGQPTRYVLAVSTLEPRKNYKRLLQAWEAACRDMKKRPLLVLVANLGWRNEQEVREITGLVEAGYVAHVNNVPLEELRVLYSNAHAVVCPSRAEGFDLSGVESMLCDTPVIASDIDVHRWVYGDAAIYFDPYSAEELAAQLKQALATEKGEGRLAELRREGLSRSRLYVEDAIKPKWEALIEQIARDKRDGRRAA